MKFIALSLLPRILLAGATPADDPPPTAINEIVLTAQVDIACDVEGCGFPSCTVANPTRYEAVAGAVLSASGSFGASYGDAGFFVDDGTGGLFVRTATHLGLAAGERVRVTGGTTACLFGTLALADGAVSVDHGAVSAAPAQPGVAFRPRQVGQLARAPAIAGDPAVAPNWCDCLAPFSATAGRAITVRGTAVADLADDGAYGHKLFLDDGAGVAQVFVDAQSAVPVDEIRDALLVRGADLCVTGVVAMFAGVGHELLPRDGADIRRADPVYGCGEGRSGKSKKSKNSKKGKARK